jgi:hypothetical protein
MDSETKPIRTYWYVAWFRDTTQPADDQDYEWPDCILIDAASADLAKLWGDELSRRFSRNQETELFLWSKTEDYNPDEPVDISATPHIAYGCEPIYGLKRGVGLNEQALDFWATIPATFGSVLFDDSKPQQTSLPTRFHQAIQALQVWVGTKKHK